MEYGRPLYFCPVVFSSSIFFFFSSPNLSGRRLDVYHYLYTWCDPSVNLECRSKMCCMRLAGNAGHKKVAKNSRSVHHCTTLSSYIFATKARIDNRKKLVKQQCLPTCPRNMVNFGLLAAEICWRAWGTPANFNRFLMLAALLHGTLVVGDVEQRAPPIFGKTAIMLGTGPHSSLLKQT